jgi:hypothetical protein
VNRTGCGDDLNLVQKLEVKPCFTDWAASKDLHPTATAANPEEI